MKLHHIAITVKDLSISIPFYTDLFSLLEVKRFRREDMRATGVFMQGENIQIELWQFDILKAGTREDLSFTGIKHIAFATTDINSVHESYLKKGITCGDIRVGKSGGSYFFISDPDLNQIEIYQPE